MGPDMAAERWLTISGDAIMWCHPPSNRVVAVTGPIAWGCCQNIPAWGVIDPRKEDDGYLVQSYFADEHGNPETGDVIWIASYGRAIKLARRIRADILGEKPVPSFAQLSLGDVGEW